MEKEQYDQYLKAVDVVCLNCTVITADDETKCGECPVRESVKELGAKAALAGLSFEIYEFEKSCGLLKVDWEDAESCGRILIGLNEDCYLLYYLGASAPELDRKLFEDALYDFLREELGEEYDEYFG